MKTTGESSIPKFLFLVFLGHPSAEVSRGSRRRRGKIGGLRRRRGSPCRGRSLSSHSQVFELSSMLMLVRYNTEAGIVRSDLLRSLLARSG